jgi:(S)-2-hydroxyglutarate dehydrogenase
MTVERSQEASFLARACRNRRTLLMDDRADVVIVGGGIIGLATAAELLRRFPRSSVLVLEKESRVGAHQSSHNSGVIHSGLYYRPGSLKARMCVEGAAAMQAFCVAQDLPLKICGKVVVATADQELPALHELARRGAANGVRNLSLLTPSQLNALEPHAFGVAALHVPGTAITDYGKVTAKLAERVAGVGGKIRTGTKVIAIRHRAGETVIETTGGTFSTRQLINCAGLYSDRLRKLSGNDLADSAETIIVPFRGEYYEIAAERRHLVNGLIYPVPDPKFPFLGIHFTPRVNGSVEVGPNAVLAFHREGYSRGRFDLADAVAMLRYPGFWRMAAKHWRSGLAECYRSLHKAAFVRDAQRLLPELTRDDLRPGGTGVRAQALDRAGNLLNDFFIARQGAIIHVLNVPSPAATASLAIARHLIDLLEIAPGPS